MVPDTDCAAGVFAVASTEVDPADDDAADPLLWPEPEVELFELVLAPPVLTAWLETAPTDRFDEPVAVCDPFDPLFGDPDVAEFPPAADDPVDVSANATPYPVENSAAPTPRATANPPTRPTKREAPMIVYLPTNGDMPLRRVNPPGGTGPRNAETVSYVFADRTYSIESR